jgi:hypothetical protein
MSGYRLIGRVARLQRRQAAAPSCGVCPHQPWRTVYEPRVPADAGPLTLADTAILPPCRCGRPCGEVVLHLADDGQTDRPAFGRTEP